MTLHSNTYHWCAIFQGRAMKGPGWKEQYIKKHKMFSTSRWIVVFLHCQVEFYWRDLCPKVFNVNVFVFMCVISPSWRWINKKNWKWINLNWNWWIFSSLTQIIHANPYPYCNIIIPLLSSQILTSIILICIHAIPHPYWNILLYSRHSTQHYIYLTNYKI